MKLGLHWHLMKCCLKGFAMFLNTAALLCYLTLSFNRFAVIGKYFENPKMLDIVLSGPLTLVYTLDLSYWSNLSFIRINDLPVWDLELTSAHYHLFLILTSTVLTVRKWSVPSEAPLSILKIFLQVAIFSTELIILLTECCITLKEPLASFTKNKSRAMFFVL